VPIAKLRGNTGLKQAITKAHRPPPAQLQRMTTPLATATLQRGAHGASGGQRGYIIITPRVQNNRDTGDTIRHVVVPVRRMIDAVLAGARHAALEADDLRNQPIVARQHDAAAVQPRQQVAIEIGLRRLADFVADPVLAK